MNLQQLNVERMEADIAQTRLDFPDEGPYFCLWEQKSWGFHFVVCIPAWWARRLSKSIREIVDSILQQQRSTHE